MSGGFFPASYTVVRYVISVHVHSEQPRYLKLSEILDALYDLLLQHDLAQPPSFALVLLGVLEDPPVDVAALGAAVVVGEPAVLVVLDVDVAAHELGQLFQLFFLEPANLAVVFLLVGLGFLGIFSGSSVLLRFGRSLGAHVEYVQHF